MPEQYAPSREHVLRVRALLQAIASFPVEVVDTILDFAQYWVRSTTVRPGKQTIRDSGLAKAGNYFMLRSLPLGLVADPSTDKDGAFGDSYATTASMPWQTPNLGPKDTARELVDRIKSDFRPRGEHPCRKIVFTISAHDQGWAGSAPGPHPYYGSYTWFDTGLERIVYDNPRESQGERAAPRVISADGTFEPLGSGSDPQATRLYTISPSVTEQPGSDRYTGCVYDHPLLPDETALQKNRMADSVTQDHVITWSWTDDIKPGSPEALELETQGRGSTTGSGEKVRSLLIGDIVTIWAKARFGGWTNCIEKVKMDVYWAV